MQNTPAGGGDGAPIATEAGAALPKRPRGRPPGKKNKMAPDAAAGGKKMVQPPKAKPTTSAVQPYPNLTNDETAKVSTDLLQWDDIDVAVAFSKYELEPAFNVMAREINVNTNQGCAIFKLYEPKSTSGINLCASKDFNTAWGSGYKRKVADIVYQRISCIFDESGHMVCKETLTSGNYE